MLLQLNPMDKLKNLSQENLQEASHVIANLINYCKIPNIMVHGSYTFS